MEEALLYFPTGQHLLNISAIMATITPETLTWPVHEFLVLPENELAYSAMTALLEPASSIAPHLLYCYGPAGSGKTHLVQELMLAHLQSHPQEKVEYLTAGEFVQQYQHKAAIGQIDSFLRQYHDVQLLVLEDLHTITQKSYAHFSLTNLIDQIQEHGGCVVLTSLISTMNLQMLEPRLISRCRGGMTASLTPLSCESRLQLLKHYGEVLELTFEQGVLPLLAEKQPGSCRELLGGIRHLASLSRIEGLPVNHSMLNKLLQYQPPGVSIKIMDIARTVAKEFKITIKDMRSKARDQEIILPRQVTMFLAREISRMHYTQIAEFFGIKSHTTVMHSCHKLATQLTTDSTLDYQVNQIKQKIQGFDHLPK